MPLLNDQPNIRIGDVGTIYAVPTFDKDPVLANFDPSGADVRQIKLSMPQADGSRRTIIRTATPAQVLINGVLTWCLTYTVVAADVVHDMHTAVGNVQLQGYVHYPDGREWHSSIEEKDQAGEIMRVVANL